jgi:hypothetical protein
MVFLLVDVLLTYSSSCGCYWNPLLLVVIAVATYLYNLNMHALVMAPRSRTMFIANKSEATY